jgi:hypothetical protein
MKLETKSGRQTAEIIGYLNTEDTSPIIVMLTNKINGYREIATYTKNLTFKENGDESGLDLVEVKL